MGSSVGAAALALASGAILFRTRPLLRNENTLRISEKLWSEDELAKYDGANSLHDPILLAADGLVFDVGTARDRYGPGAEYACFAGRDASRMLAKGLLVDEDNKSARLPLTVTEKAVLAAWVFSFKSKYPVVGQLKSNDDLLADSDMPLTEKLVSLSIAGDADGLRSILKQGCDIHWKDAEGCNALHHAAANGQVDVINLLLDSDADANVLGSKGRTPIHFACEAGNLKSVLRLISAGADMNIEAADGWRCIHFAAKNGDKKLLSWLLGSGGSGATVSSRGGVQPLHIAATYGHLEAVKTLLAAGADPEVEVGGLKARSWALRGGHAKVVELIESFPSS